MLGEIGQMKITDFLCEIEGRFIRTVDLEIMVRK